MHGGLAASMEALDSLDSLDSSSSELRMITSCFGRFAALSLPTSLISPPPSSLISVVIAVCVASSLMLYQSAMVCRAAHLFSRAVGAWWSEI
jgi:hypothetical protein